MESLIVTAVVLLRKADQQWDFQPTSDCKFEMSMEGGEFAPPEDVVLGRGVFTLPKTPRPLHLTVRATPTIKRYWPVTARFEYKGKGELVNLGSRADDDIEIFEPAAFQPASSIDFPTVFGFGGTFTSMVVYLSRVKDVTDKALQSINKVPKEGKDWVGGDNWLPAWRSKGRDNVNIISGGMLDGSGNLEFQPEATVAPEVVSRVFEVGDVEAPRLIAVSWPHLVRTHQFAGPTPFLVYFHPTIGQAASDYAGHPYPFGWPYLFFIAFRDTNWFGDPLTEYPGPKGLAYQVAAARRSAVLAVPVNKLGPEIAAILKAEEMESYLREIQAFMFRRNNAYRPPGLGHVALSGFSAGCGLLMHKFLADNQGHSFVEKILKELYLLDPRMNPSGLAAQVIKWADGNASERRVRVYISTPESAYLPVVAQKSFPKLPFVTNSASGLRTLAVTTAATWQAAAKSRGASPKTVSAVGQFGPMHELHAGTLVVHALKNSGFESA
ncbi:MAG TPA: hypothetical protein VLT62_19595 [Candidatus Methylomirabilis sp.]|nr:hypothetical protein [Candidatus Methylomirabilis sp.]HSB77661.1 hypothetical protein [Candidatus Methylomirabilis sp.]